MSIPYPDDVDVEHAAARAAAWERRKAGLPWGQIRAQWLERLDKALEEDGPVGRLWQMLQDAPVDSPRDLRGWLQTARPRQVQALGKAVMALLGEAQLAELARVDAADNDQPF